MAAVGFLITGSIQTARPVQSRKETRERQIHRLKVADGTAPFGKTRLRNPWAHKGYIALNEARPTTLLRSFPVDFYEQIGHPARIKPMLYVLKLREGEGAWHD